MGIVIKFPDTPAERKASPAARVVHIDLPAPIQPFDPEPMVIEFWSGIATLIEIFAACISFDPQQSKGGK